MWAIHLRKTNKNQIILSNPLSSVQGPGWQDPPWTGPPFLHRATHTSTQTGTMQTNQFSSCAHHRDVGGNCRPGENPHRQGETCKLHTGSALAKEQCFFCVFFFSSRLQWNNVIGGPAVHDSYLALFMLGLLIYYLFSYKRIIKSLFSQNKHYTAVKVLSCSLSLFVSPSLPPSNIALYIISLLPKSTFSICSFAMRSR